MKITEVAKKARSLSEKNLYDCDIDSAEAYEHCADMIEETILEIREELNKVRADARNERLIKRLRSKCSSMAMMLEWVLGEEAK